MRPVKAFQKSWWSQKLEDRRWQEKRNQILARDKYKCRSCQDTEDTSQLHVHHRYYKFRTEPWEYPDEALITLCKGCHAAATEYNATFDSILKTYFRPDDLLDAACLFRQFKECAMPPYILLYALEEILLDEDTFDSLLKSHLSMCEAAGSRGRAKTIKMWFASRGIEA